MVVDIDLSNTQDLILGAIYCSNRNPVLTLFETVNNLSDICHVCRRFQFKVRSFRLCQEKQLWCNAQKYSKSSKLTYLNNDKHTYLDKRTGNTDILDMAFISQNLTKHGIQFLIGDDLGSHHIPIKTSIDGQPHRNIHTNPIRYKFNQTGREVFESTLEEALSSCDVPELKSTQDIDKYADCIVTAVSTAVDKAIPTSKSGRPKSQPVSEESFALIKEKGRLRRQYSQAHDPLVKTCINQLQKEIKEKLRIESQASWVKFCSKITLETNHTGSWSKIKNSRTNLSDLPCVYQNTLV